MIYGWPAALSVLAGLGLVVALVGYYVGLILVVALRWDDNPRLARVALVWLALSVLVGIGASAAVFGVPVGDVS